MGERISFSPELLEFEQVAVSHSDLEKCIRFYYGQPSLQALDSKFVGYSVAEVEQERDQRLEDLDKNSAFNVLGALEASFRIDFLMRCYNRNKDELSRFFRDLHREKGDKISLEEDILEGWKTCFPPTKSLISDLKAAFRYRHWLAHGRYWTPKLGKKYDFSSLYLLAQAIDQQLSFQSSK